MTKIVVKKISFSTYIKFMALFGASLGLLMTALFLLMLPMMITAEITQDSAFSIVPFVITYLLCPVIGAFVFTMWGLFSYPMFLLIQKIFKKITLEVELPPMEYQPQPNNITDVSDGTPENNTDTNQGVE